MVLESHYLREIESNTSLLCPESHAKVDFVLDVEVNAKAIEAVLKTSCGSDNIYLIYGGQATILWLKKIL